MNISMTYSAIICELYAVSFQSSCHSMYLQVPHPIEIDALTGPWSRSLTYFNICSKTFKTLQSGSEISKAKETLIPADQGAAEEGGQKDCGRDGRAEGNPSLSDQGREEKAQNAGQDQTQEAADRTEAETRHKVELDVPSAETLLPGDLIKEKGEHQHAGSEKEPSRDPGSELIGYRCCRDRQGDGIDDKGSNKEAVRDRIGLQIHQGQAEQTAGERHPAQGIKAKAPAQDAAHKCAGKKELGEHVPGRDLLPAVAALSMEEEIREDRDKVQGAQHMAAGGAVASSPCDLLAMGKAPGHAVDEGPEDRSQDKGQDHNIRGERSALKDDIRLETSRIHDLNPLCSLLYPALRSSCRGAAARRF